MTDHDTERRPPAWPEEQPTRPSSPSAMTELLVELRDFRGELRELRGTQGRILETQAGQQASLKTLQSYVMALHEAVVVGVVGADGKRHSMSSRLDELELKDRAYHGSLKPPARQWKSVVAILAVVIAAFSAGAASDVGTALAALF